MKARVEYIEDGVQDVKYPAQNIKSNAQDVKKDIEDLMTEPERRKKDTGVWIFDAPEVQDWIENTTPKSQLVWGCGIAGAWKTFLSSLVIDRLQEQALSKQYGVAYIYFNFKEGDKQISSHVLASIVKQLACQINVLQAYIATQQLSFKVRPFSWEVRSFQYEICGAGSIQKRHRDGDIASYIKQKISDYPLIAMDIISAQSRDRKDMAFKVLSWLVMAKEVLDIRQLQMAVSMRNVMVDLGDQEDLPEGSTLIEVCASLVTIDEQSNTIRLAHYTIQEYLESNPTFSQEAKAIVSISCTAFLSLGNFRPYVSGTLSPKTEDLDQLWIGCAPTLGR
ncbi:hypothetical protein DFP73DRAFT_526986 [Morchella snyderi]|nr:hypothetical protein DFP73DRAFT_526986 [Morchella snyderi]